MARDRRTLLRERFEIGTSTILVFTHVMVLAMFLLFREQSGTRPLLVWGSAVSIVSVGSVLHRRRGLEFQRWFPRELVFQVVGGVTWGSIAVVAMPEDPVYQALLIAVMASVVVASSAGESQFRALYLGFVGPLSATVLFGYVIFPGGFADAASLFVVAVIFAVVSSNDDRKLHHGHVDLMLENEELVDQLAAERDTLAAANERLDRLAWTDALTGLANRAGMTRTLEAALTETIERSSRVTVACLDLDGFKNVNDQYGHRAGDLLLVAVAKRLVGVVTTDELPCRQGGDELTVIGHEADLDALGERLSALFAEPFRIDGHVLEVSASIGIATTTDPVAPDELLRRADQSLYTHKRSTGSGAYVVWQPGTPVDAPAPSPLG